MRTIQKLLIVICLMISVSCSDNKYEINDNIKLTPYESKFYQVDEGISQIVEMVFPIKNRIEGAVLQKTIFQFDDAGKLSSKTEVVGGDLIVSNYKYKLNGRIASIEVIENGQTTLYTCEYLKDEDAGTISEKLISSEGNTLQFFQYETRFGYILEFDDDTTNWKSCYSVSLDGRLSKVSTSTLDKYNSYRNLYFDEKNRISTSELVYKKYSKDSITHINKTLSKSTFEYVEDSTGNWIERIEKRKNKPIIITKRTLSYFADDSMSIASDTNQRSDFNACRADSTGESTDFSTLSGPSNILLIIVLSLTTLLILWFAIKYKTKFRNFSGQVQENGMKRLWMYNKEPYAKVGLALFVALCSFLVSILLLFLFGGAIWIVFWIMKILIYILIFLSVIAVICGIRALFGGNWLLGILLLIIGIPIGVYSEEITDFVNRLVEIGFQFMRHLNLLEWGLTLLQDYWDVMLIVFVMPVLLFAMLAVIIIVLNTVLRGTEFIITKAYNIRLPCPVCGCTDGYEYLVGGQKHPVGLHPGVYGVFSQTSPKNGSKLPTMLMNGRWKLDRECVNPNCKAKVTVQRGTTVGYGTDIHIGIVGHRSSGKSYLLYSGLSLLQTAYAGRFNQIDANNETRIEEKKRRIDARDGIQTDDKSQYRAVQLMLTDKIRRIPYHLFFYDVAGEKFNATSNAHQKAMDFYKNVESILFVVDPLMIDYTGIPTNDDLRRWIESKDQYGEKYNIGNTFSMLQEILEKAGNKSKKINFSFVCVKKDLGYFESMGYNSDTLASEEIEKFICSDMGLNNVVNSARAEFKDVRFFTVSAMSKNTDSLKMLFVETLKQKGVKL